MSLRQTRRGRHRLDELPAGRAGRRARHRGRPAAGRDRRAGVRRGRRDVVPHGRPRRCAPGPRSRRRVRDRRRSPMPTSRQPSGGAREWSRSTSRRRCPGRSSRRSWARKRHPCRSRWSTRGPWAWGSASPSWPPPRRPPRAARSTRSPGSRGSAPQRSSAVFYVDTLEHLRRGGRIGPAAALLGSALAVKPLLHLVDGHIEPLEKVRTSARAIARLEELAAERAGSGPVDVAVHHLANPDRAESLAAAAAQPAARSGRTCTRARSAPSSGRTSGPACWLWSSRPRCADRRLAARPKRPGLVARHAAPSRSTSACCGHRPQRYVRTAPSTASRVRRQAGGAAA